MDDLKSIALPGDVRAYFRTGDFDEQSVPDNLRSRHSTKEGTWAVIHVLDGHLRFCSLEPPGEERILSAGDQQVIPPTSPHAVAPEGQVRFFLEFHQPPGTGAHRARDEKAELPEGV